MWTPLTENGTILLIWYHLTGNSWWNCYMTTDHVVTNHLPERELSTWLEEASPRPYHHPREKKTYSNSKSPGWRRPKELFRRSSPRGGLLETERPAWAAGQWRCRRPPAPRRGLHNGAYSQDLAYIKLPDSYSTSRATLLCKYNDKSRNATSKQHPSNLITLHENIDTVYQINMAKQGNDI